MKLNSLSQVQLFVIPRTVAFQAPLSMGFSRQECWNGVPFPSSGHLPNPGIEPDSPALQADSLSIEPLGKPNTLQRVIWSILPANRLLFLLSPSGTSLVAQMVKCLPTMWETQVWSLSLEDPLEKEMSTHSSALAWKIQSGWRSLVVYNPWGRKESDTTERLNFQLSTKPPYFGDSF